MILLTITADDHPRVMLTCWHAGIRPGDLARSYIPRIEAKA